MKKITSKKPKSIKTIISKKYLICLQDAKENIIEFNERIVEVIYDLHTLQNYEELSQELKLRFNKCKNYLNIIWFDNNLPGDALDVIIEELKNQYEYIHKLKDGPPRHGAVVYTDDTYLEFIHRRIHISKQKIDAIFNNLGYREVKKPALENMRDKIFWNGNRSDLAEIMFYLYENQLICPKERSINGVFKIVEEHFMTKEKESNLNLRQLLEQRKTTPFWKLTKQK